jgi:hypothetical protein
MSGSLLIVVAVLICRSVLVRGDRLGSRPTQIDIALALATPSTVSPMKDPIISSLAKKYDVGNPQIIFS